MQAVWKSIAPMGFQGATIDLKAEWHARTEQRVTSERIVSGDKRGISQ